MAMVHKKVALLEVWMEAKYNEVCQETISTLEGIKAQVAAVHDSQQKMWRTIDSMGKELQEQAQGYATTNEEDTIEQVLATINLAEERQINFEAITSIAPQSIPEMASLALSLPQFFTLLEEEVCSVKDSMTSGLSAREHLCVKATGFGRPLVFCSVSKCY